MDSETATRIELMKERPSKSAGAFGLAALALSGILLLSECANGGPDAAPARTAAPAPTIR